MSSRPSRFRPALAVIPHHRPGLKTSLLASASPFLKTIQTVSRNGAVICSRFCCAFNDHGISNKRNRIRDTPLALLFGHVLQLFTDLEKNASANCLDLTFQHLHASAVNSKTRPLLLRNVPSHFLVVIFEAIALCNAIVFLLFDNQFIYSE